jgi:hypothetical protein
VAYLGFRFVFLRCPTPLLTALQGGLGRLSATLDRPSRWPLPVRLI